MSKKICAEFFAFALLATPASWALASGVGGIEIGGSGAKGFVYERVHGYGIRETNEVKVSGTHVVSPAKEFISQNQRVVSALREEMILPEDIERIADGVARIYGEFNRRSDKLSSLYLVGSSSVEKNRNTSDLAMAVKERIDDPGLQLEFISHGQETIFSLIDAVYKHRNSGMCSPYGNSIILGVDTTGAVVAAGSGGKTTEINFDGALTGDKILGAEVIGAIKSLAAKKIDIRTVYLTVGKTIGFPDDVLKIAGQIRKETHMPVRLVQDGDSDEIGRRVADMLERSKELDSLPECADLENSMVIDIGAGNTKLGYLDKTTQAYTLHSHEIPYGTATLSSYIASRSDELCFTMPDACGIKDSIPTLVDIRERLPYSHPRLFEETSKGYRNVFVVGGTPWVATKISRLGEMFNDYSCINLSDVENMAHDASPLRTLLERSLKEAVRDIEDDLKRHADEYGEAEKNAFVKKMRGRMDAMSSEVEKILSVYPMKTDELRSGALLAYWIFSELSDGSHRDRVWIWQQLNQLGPLFNGAGKAADVKSREALRRAGVAFGATDYGQARKSINEIAAQLTGAHIRALIGQAEKRLAASLSGQAKSTALRIDQRVVRGLLNLASEKAAQGDLMTAYHLLSDANAAIVAPPFAKPVSVGTCQTHEGTANARQFLVPNRVNDWLRWYIMNKEGVLVDALKYMGLIDLDFLTEPELKAQFVPEYVPTISKRSRYIRRDY